jgi:hypothetical protein
VLDLPRLRGNTHVYLPVFKAEFQVVVDGLIGHLTQQCEIRHTNLLLLGALKDRLLNLRLPSMVPFVASVSDSFGTTKTTTLLFAPGPS